jgi:argininosuccinate synthase
LIAKHLVTLARMEGATEAAHTAACGSADHLRLDAEVRSLAPGLRCVPVRCRWGLTDDEVASLARASGILELPPAAHGRIQSNVLGRLLLAPVAGAEYRLTRAVADAPDEAALVDLELLEGIPVRANGVEMPLVEMIESIETIAGTHAVGRLPGADGAAAESPAAVVLDAASRALRGASGSVVLRLARGSCEVVSARAAAAVPEPTASPLG